MKPKRPAVIENFLHMLDQAYEKERKKVVPIYPYDKETNTIKLPPKIVAEIRRLAQSGQVPEAIKRVAELTGAGLRLSKDYVDKLR